MFYVRISENSDRVGQKQPVPTPLLLTLIRGELVGQVYEKTIRTTFELMRFIFTEIEAFKLSASSPTSLINSLHCAF